MYLPACFSWAFRMSSSPLASSCEQKQQSFISVHFSPTIWHLGYKRYIFPLKKKKKEHCEGICCRYANHMFLFRLLKLWVSIPQAENKMSELLKIPFSPNIFNIVLFLLSEGHTERNQRIKLFPWYLLKRNVKV